jgi:hypothetical protein
MTMLEGFRIKIIAHTLPACTLMYTIISYLVFSKSET